MQAAFRVRNLTVQRVVTGADHDHPARPNSAFIPICWTDLTRARFEADPLAFAERNCLPLDPVVDEPPAIIQTMPTGKADVGTGDRDRTAERAEALGLPQPIHLGQMVIHSTSGVDKVEDLIGKALGSVAGFLWVEQLRQLLGDGLHLYRTPVAPAQDHSAGRVEIAVDFGPTGCAAEHRATPDLRCPSASR